MHLRVLGQARAAPHAATASSAVQQPRREQQGNLTLLISNGMLSSAGQASRLT